MSTQPTDVVAVLWDLDGTLIATEDLHLALEVEALASVGITIAPEVYRDRFTGAPTSVGFGRLVREAGLAPEALDAALTYKRERGLARVVEQAWPRRGAERVLVEIPMRTHRFALVTSAERYVADAVLARFGWAWRFEAVVTADDVTAPKPDPQPFARACEALGIPPSRALAVEDAPLGVASARAAGCRVAALPGTFPQAALGEADFLLSNLGAVPGLLSVLG